MFAFGHYWRREYSHVRNIFLPSIALTLFFTGWGIVGPFFSINAHNILVDPVFVGIFFSIWGLVRLFTDTFVGNFIDRQDAKRVVSISLFLYIIIGLGYYIIDSAGLLLAWRFVHSLVGSFFWVGIWTYNYETIPRRHRAESITFQNIMRSIPELFAPFIGAVIFGSSSPRLVFVFLSVFMFLSFIIFVTKGRSIKKVRKGKKVNSLLVSEYRMFLRLGSRIVFIALLLTSIFFMSDSFAVFFPIFLSNSGFSPLVIALFSVIFVTPIFFTLPIGALADKVGRKPVLSLGVSLMFLAFLSLFLSDNLLLMLLSVLMLGASFAITTPTANSIVGDMAVNGETGALTGVAETFKDIGALAGPFVAGLVMHVFGFKIMLLILMVVPVILLFLNYRFKF